jgi:hypothetical protein
MKRRILVFLFAQTLIAGSCQQQNGVEIYSQENFKQYWYAGKAEINSYKLVQSRYGEPREGSAVMIFVTEDFSRNNHVKLDNPSDAGRDKVNVLKMNFTKNFDTGIYPYSMMESVFTPVDRKKNPNTLKTSMSCQEWCGHVFTQLNLRGKGYDVHSYSYFEQEGDAQISVRKVLLEDEIWNIIRLNYDDLPIGSFELVPALFFTRLSHRPLKPETVNASLTRKDDMYTYSIEIPGQERNVTIDFQAQFPHKILGWKETFIERNMQQETTATLDKTLVTDYWTKNKNEFHYLRDSLNLSTSRQK